MAAPETGVENPTFQGYEDLDAIATSTDKVIKLTEEGDTKKEKFQVGKSLAALIAALTLSFAASLTLINSITSLYPDGNVGITALAIGGTSQLISSAFIVSPSIKIWGCKRMLQIGFILNILFVTSFFYRNWICLIIAAMFFGISFSLVMTSGFMCANTTGYWLAKIIKQVDNIETILVGVSGLVNGALGAGFIWGNLALYFILGPPPESDVNEAQEFCGSAYCNEELNVTTLEPPSPERYFTLIGTLTAMACTAFVLGFFIEDFAPRLGHVCAKKSEAFSIFLSTWKLLKNPQAFLLVPITLAMAMEEAFLVGDLTMAMISCSLGISMVGLVMLAFGITELIVSFGSWFLVDKFGRPFSVMAAIVILLTAITTLLLWKTNPKEVVVYFVLVCSWASADAILVSVIFATYGALFEDNLEGAFAVSSFWLSLGLSIWFAWSQFLCVYIKLYILVAMFSISFIMYVFLEKRVLK